MSDAYTAAREAIAEAERACADCNRVGPTTCSERGGQGCGMEHRHRVNERAAEACERLAIQARLDAATVLLANEDADWIRAVAADYEARAAEYRKRAEGRTE